jgi:hypothetical protein
MIFFSRNLTHAQMRFRSRDSPRTNRELPPSPLAINTGVSRGSPAEGLDCYPIAEKKPNYAQ